MNYDTTTIGLVGLRDQGLIFGQVLDDLGLNLAGADVNPDVRETFERQFDADTYDDPKQLFEADIDAAVICSPNKYHVEPAIAALRHGYDVFVDKPLSHDLAGAQKIAAVEQEVDQFCMVGFHFRFDSACRILGEYIDDGYFGEIYHIEGRHIRRRGIPGRGTWYTSKDIAGGGAAIDIGVHVVDIILSFLDTPQIEEMMGVTRTKFGHREDYIYQHMHGEEGKPHRFNVEDSATMLLETDTGASASAEVAWAANGDPEHEYHIYGTDAGATLDLADTSFSEGYTRDETGAHNRITIYEARTKGEPHFSTSELEVERNDAFTAQFEYFLDHVESGEQPPINTAAQAVRVQNVISELYQ